MSEWPPVTKLWRGSKTKVLGFSQDSDEGREFEDYVPMERVDPVLKERDALLAEVQRIHMEEASVGESPCNCQWCIRLDVEPKS